MGEEGRVSGAAAPMNTEGLTLLVAGWNAHSPFLKPQVLELVLSRDAASAAASVTRTASNARLRSVMTGISRPRIGTITFFPTNSR